MADFDEETRIASREGVSLRTPPHSIEAEESRLACCLIDSGDTLTLARTSGVTAESFYEPAHRVVFESLCSMELSARPIDEVVLEAEPLPSLAKDGVVARVALAAGMPYPALVAETIDRLILRVPETRASQAAVMLQ